MRFRDESLPLNAGDTFLSVARKLPFNLGDPKSLASQLAKATLGSAGMRILGMAVTFGVGVQLARYLGPEGYGVYGTVMAIAALLIVPAQLGLPQLVTREIASSVRRQSWSEARGVVNGYFGAVAAASVAMVVLGLIAHWLWLQTHGGRAQSTQMVAAYYWGIAIVPVFALTNLAASVIRGLHRPVLSLFFETLLRPVLYGIVLFAAFAALGGVTAVLALSSHVWVAAGVLALVCVWMWLALPEQIRSANANYAAAPSWRRAATPMLTTEIVRVADSQYAILMLGLLVSIDHVGLFRVAVATGALLGLPGTLVNVVIMPYVVELKHANDTRRLQMAATGAAALNFAATALMTLIMYLFGERLLEIAFGRQFVPAWPALMAIGVSYSLRAFFGSAASILNMADGERTVALAYGLGLACGIPVTWVLTKYYGIAGAAAGMIVSAIVESVILRQDALRKLGIDTTVLSLAVLVFRR